MMTGLEELPHQRRWSWLAVLCLAVLCLVVFCWFPVMAQQTPSQGNHAGDSTTSEGGPPGSFSSPAYPQTPGGSFPSSALPVPSYSGAVSQPPDFLPGPDQKSSFPQAYPLTSGTSLPSSSVPVALGVPYYGENFAPSGGSLAVPPAGFPATPSGAYAPGTVLAAPPVYDPVQPIPAPPLSDPPDVPLVQESPVPTPYDDISGLSDRDDFPELRIVGNQRIESSAIINYMDLSPGVVLTPRVLDQALKSLYATGLFSNVDMIREGDILVVTVQENPIINELVFEGNSDVSDENLDAEVQLRPRVVYTRSKVQADTQRILEIYRRAGRFAARVDPKIIRLSDNRVNLVFEIDEGQITRVLRIVFVGNHHFSDKTLRGAILTQEKRWYRFLARDDTYDPDRVAFDRELLRRFYLHNGYIDFRVISASAELTSDLENFFLTFALDEGERYKVGKTSIGTDIRDLQNLNLEDEIETESGDWYDAEEVEKTITAITEAAGSVGYAFVDVRPQIKRHPEEKRVDIHYLIDEGERVFVERIEIKGNVRTLDKVIRREIELVAGDAFNLAKIRRSQRLLTNLSLFEKVEITNAPGSGPDRTIITVEIEEKATGELSIGGGFSTRDGLLGNVGVRERNLLGRGQELGLRLGISGRTQQIDLSFTEPYFLDRNLSAGFDVFHIERDYLRESGYEQRSFGGGVRIGYKLIGDLRQSWRYTIRQDTISNVRFGVSRFIRNQRGTFTKSVIGQSLTLDVLDDRIDPSDGYFLQLTNNFAGLGGDIRYLETLFKGSFYYPFVPDWVGSISLNAGHIFALENQIRLVDRFFLGGDDMRGFAYAGVGPRDIRTGDSLGGETYAVLQAELDFPLGLPRELGISGRLFSDIGTLTDNPDSGASVRKSSKARVSVGTGIAWTSPFGPVKIFYGKPLVREPYDRTEAIRFSFGTNF